MPSGKRVMRPLLRPGTSSVTQRRGMRPRPCIAAQNRANRRAVRSPRPPAYIARRSSSVNGHRATATSFRAERTVRRRAKRERCMSVGRDSRNLHTSRDRHGPGGRGAVSSIGRSSCRTNAVERDSRRDARSWCHTQDRAGSRTTTHQPRWERRCQRRRASGTSFLSACEGCSIRKTSRRIARRDVIANNLADLAIRRAAEPSLCWPQPYRLEVPARRHIETGPVVVRWTYVSHASPPRGQTRVFARSLRCRVLLRSSAANNVGGECDPSINLSTRRDKGLSTVSGWPKRVVAFRPSVRPHFRRAERPEILTRWP